MKNAKDIRVDKAIERFNRAVERADQETRGLFDRLSPEDLFKTLLSLSKNSAADELLQAGIPLGYFNHKATTKY